MLQGVRNELIDEQPATNGLVDIKTDVLDIKFEINLLHINLVH